MYQLAVDVGGTFTDGVLVNTHDNRIVLAKSLTTPDDPGDGISKVVQQLVAEGEKVFDGFHTGAITRMVHGTTLITNALIERRGERCALIVTDGTEDTPEIARETRFDPYDLALERPAPLNIRSDRRSISARMAANGTEIAPLTAAESDRITKWLQEEGFASAAICLLHAPVNAAHEASLASTLRRALPETCISVSSEVAAELGEYERMSTVTANAFVQPLTRRYMRSLRDRLSKDGLDLLLDIIVSDGAFTDATTAADIPIRLLESGPAGGVLSAMNAGACENLNNVLAFDMGGTTAKACVAKDLSPEMTHMFEFGRVRRFAKGSGLPAITPSIDLIEIGAGGGSIASVDELGLLKVGPHSAGADPGPACYGLGGTEPTVTDANLILGYLDADGFLGGQMTLDRKAAEAAVASVANKVGLNPLEAAWGIYDIVSENMAGAARTHIAEKGFDPRSFTMVATGGAGPMHAVEVARRLRISKVLFPVASGVGSCLGFLAAPARADRSWSRVQRLTELDVTVVGQTTAQAEREIVAQLAEARVPGDAIDWHFEAEMRYVGQGSTIRVDLSVLIGTGELEREAIAQSFLTEYARVYGAVIGGGRIEVVTWRISGQSLTEARVFRQAPSVAVVADGTRAVFDPITRQFAPARVVDRASMEPGATWRAPLIVTEPECTIVVPVEADVALLKSGAIMVVLEGLS